MIEAIVSQEQVLAVGKPLVIQWECKWCGSKMATDLTLAKSLERMPVPPFAEHAMFKCPMCGHDTRATVKRPEKKA
jgi:transcription elongation factor Elf1